MKVMTEQAQPRLEWEWIELEQPSPMAKALAQPVQERAKAQRWTQQSLEERRSQPQAPVLVPTS
jgi:hypothetical protein